VGKYKLISYLAARDETFAGEHGRATPLAGEP